jgi:hypothetical protein
MEVDERARAADREASRAWRRDRLRGAGFAPGEADQLASDARLDLHELIGLVERGCRHDLAIRIVAPLDRS